MGESILKADGMFGWYVPNAVIDDIKLVAGTIEIAENGVSTLSLVGLLLDDTPAEISSGFKVIDTKKCIVGILKDSRHVFLRQIRNNGVTWSSVLSHQGYKASETIVFQDFQESVDLDAVTNISIRLDALESWISEPAVKLRKTPLGGAAHAIHPKTRTFDLPNKTVHLKTNIKYTAPENIWIHSVTIKQESFLEVVYFTPRSLDSICEEFSLIENFLLFLTDVDVALPWPTVKYGDQVGHYYFQRRESDSQNVDILKSWVTLKSQAINFGTLLSSLEEQQNILGPGLYLYLGIQRSPALYLENRFSTAIFGLESLHRRVGNSATSSKLQDKINRIIGDVKCPKDQRWLQGRLKNAGEPNLEERLFITLSEIDIGLDKNKLRSFSRECADLRNQVAHFGGQRDGSYNVFVQRMYTLNEAVRPLYHAILLNRIGLDHDHIWAYFHRSPYSPHRKKILEAAGLTFTPPIAPC